MSLSVDASSIVGVRIPAGQWRSVIERLDRQGAFSRKHMMEFIILLCERVEKLEAHDGGSSDNAKPEPKAPVQSE